jgi:hypothetical protein
MKATDFNYEYAISKIEQINQKPKVVEILWDGDTHGWFIMMFVVTETGFWKFKKQNVYHLGNISDKDGDLRLFNGVAPPWPEAILAKDIAEKLKAKYNLEIYFPSPNEPDDDCPRWIERKKGIECEDCRKLIIPTTSEYLPKNICYNCHLKRERQYSIQVLAGDGNLSELREIFDYKHTQLEMDIALENAIAYSQITTAEYLLSIGADISNYNYQGVYYAVHNDELEGLKFAISKGVDINIRNGMLLNESIMTSTNSKSIEMVKWLLGNGADPKLLTNDSLKLVSSYGTDELQELIKNVT